MPKGVSRDRRVRRTRDLLHGALGSLIHEKAYDDIVVKEILARANVGRSTFYTHFRDKDELLESSIRDVLRAGEMTSSARSTSAADRILRFSLPILEHIERYRGAGDSTHDAQRQAVVHERLERVLAELVADDLRRADLHQQESVVDVPCGLLAQYVASTFLAVLHWWFECGDGLSAKKVNDLYRALILPTLAEVLD